MSSAMELELRTPAQVATGARSKIYAFLAEALSFPDQALARRLASGDWFNDFTDAMAFVPFSFKLAGDQRTSLAQAPPSRTLEHDYIRLFEVGPGGPFCALYEGAHRGGRMKIMEELVRFYEHFGLKPASGDQPDHLCAELEFVHYLTFKQAAADEGTPAFASLATAERDFLYRHLCKWLPRLVSRLGGAPEPSLFYFSLTSLTSDFCRADLAWLKVMCQEIPDPQIRPLPD